MTNIIFEIKKTTFQ